MFLKTFFLYVLDNLNITYSVAAALITSVPNPFFFLIRLTFFGTEMLFLNSKNKVITSNFKSM